MGRPRLSSQELVRRLWRDVQARADVETRTDLPHLPPHDRLLHSEHLRYLNTHWNLVHRSAESVGERAGSVRARVKDRLGRFIAAQLEHLLEDERDFRANLVRVANSFAIDNDRVADEVRQVAEALRIESQRLVEESELRHRLLEQRVEALEKQYMTEP